MAAAKRQPASTGLALRDAYPWADLAGLARTGEAAGYRALFMPEVGSRDTLAALTGLAGETDRLLLGTGVVPLPARSPSLLAAAAATAQERSAGRLLLGLGTGRSTPGSLDRLRRTIAALRAAFAGEVGTVDGAEVTIGLSLERPPEIWIAALGPRAAHLAGEVADGVILNWCTPQRVALAVTQIVEGAAGTGRDPSRITIAVYVRAALVDGSEGPARAAAAEYASYPAYARQFEAMGIDPSDVDAVLRGVVLTDAATGLERLDAYRAAGADLPVVYPVLPAGPPSPDAARRTLDPFAPNLT